MVTGAGDMTLWTQAGLSPRQDRAARALGLWIDGGKKKNALYSWVCSRALHKWWVSLTLPVPPHRGIWGQMQKDLEARTGGEGRRPGVPRDSEMLAGDHSKPCW